MLQQSPTIGNWLRAANMLTTRDQWVKDGGPLTDETIAIIRRIYGLGWWGEVSLRLYGPASVTDATSPIREQAIQAIRPLPSKPYLWRRGDPIATHQGINQGVPATFPMQNASWYCGRG